MNDCKYLCITAVAGTWFNYTYIAIPTDAIITCTLVLAYWYKSLNKL